MKNFILCGLIFSAILISGCASTSTNYVRKCTSGDCTNGQGIFFDNSGKRTITYQGDFKNGKLWNGTITKELPAGETFINVIQDGKTVVKTY